MLDEIMDVYALYKQAKRGQDIAPGCAPDLQDEFVQKVCDYLATKGYSAWVSPGSIFFELKGYDENGRTVFNLTFHPDGLKDLRAYLEAIPNVEEKRREDKELEAAHKELWGDKYPWV